MPVKRFRFLIAPLIALVAFAAALTLTSPHQALAHPLGNFTINQYSGITLTSNTILIRYIVDMAEIPAFQELSNIDLDGDDEVSVEENELYLYNTIDQTIEGLSLSLNNSPVKLDLIESKLTFPPGLGGLSTLRLVLELRGDMDVPIGSENELAYRVDNFQNDLGWREIVVNRNPAVTIIRGAANGTSVTNELQSYPDDLLTSPLDMREVSFAFMLTGSDEGEQEPAAESVIDSPADQSNDFLTRLITVDQLSFPIVIIAFAAALGLGALHAASPGHGKTIMAAYLVGTRGTAVHALFLGFTVTVSHTLGVVALGLVVLFASNVVDPETLYPWLGLASGLVIISIGAILLLGRVLDHFQSTHSHAHDKAIHMEQKTAASTSGFAKFSSKVSSIGMRLLHGHTHDENGHHHSHTHDSQRDTGTLRLTWKNLTALGIVGGLVPSASALIILIASISLQRVAFGLLLILAFSMGMAFVLSGIGLLLVYAGKLVGRINSPARLTQAFARLLPAATAIIVLLSGLFITLRSILQLGGI